MKGKILIWERISQIDFWYWFLFLSPFINFYQKVIESDRADYFSIEICVFLLSEVLSYWNITGILWWKFW